MPVFVSLLRGVNLGPYNRIKMDELRSLYESLGFRDVQTYIQSGNVVLRSKGRGAAAVSQQIERGIEEKFGFQSDVVLRTAAELESVIQRNPFRERPGIEPGKLLVTFLRSDPSPEAHAGIQGIEGLPEELKLDGRELYTYFPNGSGRSKLTPSRIDRILKTPNTGRNWNTVCTLFEMARKLESA